MPQPKERGTVNRTEISGKLIELGALRHTPAGVPAIDFRLAHESEQDEADKPMRVACEIACVALGAPALLLRAAAPGDKVGLAGFLAARSVRNRGAVLHVTNIEFIEGNENGIQT